MLRNLLLQTSKNHLQPTQFTSISLLRTFCSKTSKPSTSHSAYSSSQTINTCPHIFSCMPYRSALKYHRNKFFLQGLGTAILSGFFFSQEYFFLATVPWPYIIAVFLRTRMDTPIQGFVLKIDYCDGWGEKSKGKGDPNLAKSVRITTLNKTFIVKLQDITPVTDFKGARTALERRSLDYLNPTKQPLADFKGAKTSFRKEFQELNEVSSGHHLTAYEGKPLRFDEKPDMFYYFLNCGTELCLISFKYALEGLDMNLDDFLRVLQGNFTIKTPKWKELEKKEDMKRYLDQSFKELEAQEKPKKIAQEDGKQKEVKKLEGQKKAK